MVREVLKAFIGKDAVLARQVVLKDDELDKLYVQSLRVLLTYMMQDPALVRDATFLLWVAHNLCFALGMRLLAGM